MEIVRSREIYEIPVIDNLEEDSLTFLQFGMRVSCDNSTLDVLNLAVGRNTRIFCVIGC